MTQISPTYTSSTNKLQIELKLNREMNASQLMNQNVDSIFQKGAPAPANPTPAASGLADKKSKFQGPKDMKDLSSNPTPLNNEKPNHDAATASGVKVADY